MTCPSCQNKLPAGAMFCNVCGGAATVYDPPEGFVLDPESLRYYRSETVDGGAQCVTWFDANTGEYEQVSESGEVQSEPQPESEPVPHTEPEPAPIENAAQSLPLPEHIEPVAPIREVASPPKAAPRTCPHCGSPMPLGVQACFRCGKTPNMPVAPVVGAIPAPPPPLPLEPPTAKKAGGKGIIAAVLIVVLLLGGAVGGHFMGLYSLPMLQGGSETSENGGANGNNPDNPSGSDNTQTPDPSGNGGTDNPGNGQNGASEYIPPHTLPSLPGTSDLGTVIVDHNDPATWLFLTPIEKAFSHESYRFTIVHPQARAGFDAYDPDPNTRRDWDWNFPPLSWDSDIKIEAGGPGELVVTVGSDFRYGGSILYEGYYDGYGSFYSKAIFNAYAHTQMNIAAGNTTEIHVPLLGFYNADGVKQKVNADGAMVRYWINYFNDNTYEPIIISEGTAHMNAGGSIFTIRDAKLTEHYESLPAETFPYYSMNFMLTVGGVEYHGDAMLNTWYE